MKILPLFTMLSPQPIQVANSVQWQTTLVVQAHGRIYAGTIWNVILYILTSIQVKCPPPSQDARDVECRRLLGCFCAITTLLCIERWRQKVQHETAAST
jgi:hypothetical protein